MTKPATIRWVYPENQELSGPQHARSSCRSLMAMECAQSVVGVYHTMTQAEEAVHTLDQAGFPVKHISIVTQNLVSHTAIHGYITPGDDLTPRGAAAGAWLGGLGSVLIGAAFLWAPGFGSLLVLGRLAALLLAGVEGALVGAAAGGLLGALVSWGIAEEHILDYAQQVQGGKHLVIAYGTSADVARAHAILQDTQAGALHLHTVLRAGGHP
jgi:heat induced stress protein YflT